MLLWAVVTSLLVYFIVGVLWVALLRVGQKKSIKLAAAGVFVISAGWKMVSHDAIVCKSSSLVYFISSFYAMSVCATFIVLALDNPAVYRCNSISHVTFSDRNYATKFVLGFHLKYKTMEGASLYSTNWTP